MKNSTAKEKALRHEQLLASCDETRQRCNKLSREEREQLANEALRIIYGSNAKTTARRR